MDKRNFYSISQWLDLTGVTGFLFDAQDRGIDTEPIQFLINDVVIGQWSNNGWPGGVGSGWGNTAQTYDVFIPLDSSYTGTHVLTIRHYVNSTYLPADPKYYWIDNLRTLGEETEIPEPATWTLLTLGLPAALLVRGRLLKRR